MPNVIYVSQDVHTWADLAARSLEEKGPVILIFEKFNRVQQTILYKNFHGYQIQKHTGALPLAYRTIGIKRWGTQWYERLVRYAKVGFVQVLPDTLRTSADRFASVPRTGPVRFGARPPMAQHQAATEAGRLESSEGTKRCPVCGKYLPLASFQARVSGADYPRQGYCKVCQKYYLRWWRRLHSGVAVGTFRKWVAEDPQWRFETEFSG